MQNVDILIVLIIFFLLRQHLKYNVSFPVQKGNKIIAITILFVTFVNVFHDIWLFLPLSLEYNFNTNRNVLKWFAQQRLLFNNPSRDVYLLQTTGCETFTVVGFFYFLS